MALRACVLLCALLVALCGGSVVLAPTGCAYSHVYSQTFSPVGVLTLNIQTAGTTNDEILFSTSSSASVLTVYTTAYSSSSADVTAYQFGNSHSQTTLTFTATLPSTQSTTACKARSVVTVAAPASVHTICFNGFCYCNCAAKGCGVNIHFATTNSYIYNTLNYTGFGRARMDYNWAEVEYSVGRYTYTDYDTLTSNLVQRDIMPYYILDYTNPLYNGNKSPNTPASIKAFANWAANSTVHSQGKNIIWEMYNEPNIGFWTPTPKVADYVSLASATGQAIKGATPHEIYIGPAVAGYDTAFLTSCFQSGLLNYWDAVSVHFYRGSNPETAAADYATLRQLIRRNLPSSKKNVGILSGEWGYTTEVGQPDSRQVTETVQAQYVIRQYLNNLMNDVPVSIWYDFRDDGTDSTNSEDRFGLYRNTFSSTVPAFQPKPSGQAVKNFFHLVRNLRFNKRITVSDTNSYVLMFTDADVATKFVLIAWTTSSTATSIKIPSSAGSFTVSDMLGSTSSTLTASGGFVTITVSQSPQYLTPTGTNEFLEVAAAIKRLPLEIFGVGYVNVPIYVRNPLTHSITVQIASEPQVTVAPGQTAIGSFSVFNDLQNMGGTVQHFAVQIVGMGSITLSTTVIYDYPIQAFPTEPTASGITVLFTNPTGKAFSGSATITANGHVTNENLVFATGATMTSFSVPVGLTDLTTKYTVTVSIYDASKRQISSKSHQYQLADDFSKYAVGTFPSTMTTYISGDASVAITESIKIANPPTPQVPAMAITYNVAAGWKYIMVLPKTATPINGVPVGCGMWIYGDGHNNWANVRLRDSTGQTFQYSFGQVSWTGWRWVSMSFANPINPGHWGGANDGVWHTPMYWDTYYVLDSSQSAASGTTYFSAPIAFF
eukprot:Phypoly_transcript_02299.p1 GENE.Phypoly_transcript_02299~~Phypoly_transcript_02299.p1  ORF type:complete len:888 (+),score=128.15 Phypoly_transcript_02299:167-2830(+)